MKTPNSGFTLFELMVGISIMGILVSLAVPSFQDYGRNTRAISAQNDLVTALNYARSEAIRRSQAVTVCATSTFLACGTADTWVNGWMVYVEQTGVGLGVRANDEEILQMWRGPGVENVEIESTGLGSRFVSFTPTGMVTPALNTKSLELNSVSCESGAERRRRIEISPIGAIRNVRVACP